MMTTLRNPRKITPAQLQYLDGTLDEFGDLSGIVVNSDGWQVCGNQRLKLMKAEGEIVITDRFKPADKHGTTAAGFILWRGGRYAYREVDWPADKAKRANVIANNAGGSFDWDILREDFSLGELAEVGFDAAALADMQEAAESLAAMLEEQAAGDEGQAGNAEPQIDQAAELAEKWQTKAGQLWAIGEHRLIIGDCTDAGIVARVMGGELSSLVVTDPPYGVSYADKNKWLNTIGKANRIETPIENDHASREDMQKLWREAFSQMNTVMDKGAVVYCFMPQGGDQMMMMMMMMGAGIEPRHELIWLKNNHVLGRSDYNYKHEPILYAWKEGGHKFYGGFQTSVMECNKPNKSGLHPTTKPTELIERLVNNSSETGAIVFDPFAGSGTTGIACQNLGRKARLIEISPNYGAVILERFITAFPSIDIHLLQDAGE